MPVADLIAFQIGYQLQLSEFLTVSRGSQKKPELRHVLNRLGGLIDRGPAASASR